MMEMKIKIDVPELVAAVEKLAAAIDKTALNITVPNEGTLTYAHRCGSRTRCAGNCSDLHP